VATDQISSRFAVYEDSANDGELLLRVSDLNSLSQYAKAAHYLASLAPVKNVYALQVDQYQVDFHIELSGDESDLKRIIALGKTLVPDTRVIVSKETVTDMSKNISPPIGTGTDIEATTQSPNNNQPANNAQPKNNIPFNLLRYRLNG